MCGVVHFAFKQETLMNTGSTLRICITLILIGSTCLAGLNEKVHPNFSPISLTEKEVPYSIGVWDKKFGNHRTLVTVAEASDAVYVHIPWRRRDTDAENKNVTVSDLNGQEIPNRVVLNMSRESADITFQPTGGAGVYAIYYLTPQLKPNPIKGGHLNSFPGTFYTTPQATAEFAWLDKHGLGSGDMWKTLPKAEVKEIQALKVTGPASMSDFNAFYPMEVVATAAESKHLAQRHTADAFLTFPEDRMFPIRMTQDLPLRWIKKGPSSTFTGQADKHEFYVFQIGVYALKDLAHLTVTFSDLAGPKSEKIEAKALRCFNMGGTDWLGQAFTKDISVAQNRVQALWFGVDIPQQVVSGNYHGTLTLTAAGQSSKTVALTLQVSDKVLADRGDGQLWRQSRLRWLDSKIGLDETLLPPFTPVKMVGRDFEILGRRLRLSANGLPESMVSHISLGKINKQGREVLDKPTAFVVEQADGPVAFKTSGFRITDTTPGQVVFEDIWKAKGFEALLNGTLESDGYMRYRVTLTALQDTTIKDIRIELPFRKDVARYLMGRLGGTRKSSRGAYSGFRPAEASAPIEKGIMFNMVWSGDFNAGLGLLLKNDDDEWNNDGKSSAYTPTLPGWENDGQGRYRVKEQGETALITVSNGGRTMKKGDEVKFNFALLVTPFKPLRKERWDDRVFHPANEGQISNLAKANHAKIVTLHQGNSYNPYINYPFRKDAYLKDFVDKAHAKDLKVKLYYTVRELSTRAAEMWTLRSLGDEVFVKDEGYLGFSKKPASAQSHHYSRSGGPWLCEHLIEDYRTRWHAAVPNKGNREEARLIGGERDGSIAVQGLSRWHNYYIEGLKYLMQTTGIDGLYLDGIGYDRAVLKRLRKAMLLSGKTPMIDFHGAINVHHMTLAPYLDSIWYGESAHYEWGPEYWLVEIAGIPYGLSGELLAINRHANLHRAMLYGIGRRAGWFNNYTVNPLWAFWKEFGIQDAEFLPYFDEENCPVISDNDKIKVSVYKKDGKALLAIASWEAKPVPVNLKIDWKALGLNPAKVQMSVPAIEHLQPAEKLTVGAPITIPAYNGRLVMLQEEFETPIESDTFGFSVQMSTGNAVGTFLEELEAKAGYSNTSTNIPPCEFEKIINNCNISPPSFKADKAEFHVYIPKSVKKVKAAFYISRHGIGSHSFGSPVLRKFAKDEDVALVGFNGNPVQRGLFPVSLLDPHIKRLADLSKHPELTEVPFFTFGHSNGSGFSGGLASQRPEKVIAWVSFHSGYSNYLQFPNTEKVPALVMHGTRDVWFQRHSQHKAVHTMRTKRDAAMCLMMEGSVGHGPVNSETTWEFIVDFCKSAMRIRLNNDGSLKPVDIKSGWLGTVYDFKTQGEQRLNIAPYKDFKGDKSSANWLPDEEFAILWQKYGATKADPKNKPRYLRTPKVNADDIQRSTL